MITGLTKILLRLTEESLTSLLAKKKKSPRLCPHLASITEEARAQANIFCLTSGWMRVKGVMAVISRNAMRKWKWKI